MDKAFGVLMGVFFGVAVLVCSLISVDAYQHRNDPNPFFAEGLECGRSGIPDTACPYSSSWNEAGGNRQQWLKGWIAGKAEAKAK